MTSSKKIGIIGGGQLAQMLCIAAGDIGVPTLVLEPSPSCPAARVSPVLTQAIDSTGVLELSAHADKITFEFENVEISTLSRVPENKFLPTVRALEIGQDRINEKNLFTQLNIPTVPFKAVDSLQDAKNAMQQLGLPLVLKTRRLGYDGKGQRIIKEAQELEPALRDLGSGEFGGAQLIAEGFCKFESECSIIAARAISGEIRYYPLVNNIHHQGILHRSTPIMENTNQFKLATGYIEKILNHFNYVGVLTLELFCSGDKLLANEIAPRVHNSGHWTIEGTECSQFENHIRAVAQLPLGSTELRGHTVMYNLIGRLPDLNKILQVPGAHLHLYGKSERPGRKLGHVTVTAGSREQLNERAGLVEQMIG
jgi:5-(carboxyamino)imidazole ribonucleotide synthase